MVSLDKSRATLRFTGLEDSAGPRGRWLGLNGSKRPQQGPRKPSGQAEKFYNHHHRSKHLVI